MSQPRTVWGAIAIALLSQGCASSGGRVRGEPAWERRVMLFGEERAVKEATPILERPYRPLHIYGNTVRRMHYRGTVLPTVQDMREMVGPAYSSPAN